MHWLFVAAAVAIAATFVMTLVGAFLPTHKGWILAALRLRYLVLGLGFLALGGYMTASGLIRWIDWGSVVAGLFVMGLGGAYLYGRGGIPPTLPPGSGDGPRGPRNMGSA